MHHKGLKSSGILHKLSALSGSNKLTDYFKKQKKAIAERISAAAFFVSRWSPKLLLGFLLVLFLPYIITMCFRGDSKAITVKQQIYQYKDCPVLELKEEHGTLYLPIEIYLKGVLGGYIYANSLETKSKYRENGEMILLEQNPLYLGQTKGSAVSTNKAAVKLDESQLRELAIRCRSRIYYEYCCGKMKSGEGSYEYSSEEMKSGENYSSRTEFVNYYFSDAELRQLFGNHWDTVAEQLSNCIEDTWGKVYGKEGSVISVPLEGDIQEQLYLAW